MKHLQFYDIFMKMQKYLVKTQVYNDLNHPAERISLHRGKNKTEKGFQRITIVVFVNCELDFQIFQICDFEYYFANT